MNTQYIYVNNYLQLAFYERICDNSNIGIILVHGLAEHKGRYFDFISQIHKRGFSVFALDIRGHGESTGQRGDINDFHDYISDLHVFIENIKRKYPNMIIALLGHSLGGMISIGYVEQYDDVDLLVLSSPLLSSPNVSKVLNILPYKKMSSFKIKKRHSETA